MMMMMMMMMMMRVVLLLGACCFCVGLSLDEETYGSILRIKLHRKAESIDFMPRGLYREMNLWRHDDSSNTQRSRGKVSGDYFVIDRLTQMHNGMYTMKDKYERPLFVKTLDVRANKESYDRRAGESLSIAYNLDIRSCNIYFYADKNPRNTAIVHRGWLKDISECAGFQMLTPCGIVNQNLQVSCSGRYEFRDTNDNTALVVTLKVEPSSQSDLSKVGIGFGIFGGILFCCTCVKCCCGGDDSSTEKDGAETPDDATSPAAPAATYQQYDSDPVRPRSRQPSPHSGARHPTQRPHTPTGPLIHNRPHKPPAYSKIKNERSECERGGNEASVPVFLKMGSGPAEQPDAPTVPIFTESVCDEPRFELKGMTFPSALGSDSANSDVYTSDKLNFL